MIIQQTEEIKETDSSNESDSETAKSIDENEKTNVGMRRVETLRIMNKKVNTSSIYKGPSEKLDPSIVKFSLDSPENIAVMGQSNQMEVDSDPFQEETEQYE